MSSDLEQALRMNQAAEAHRVALIPYNDALTAVFVVIRGQAVENEWKRSFGFLQRSRFPDEGAQPVRRNSDFAWLDILADNLEELARVYPAARQADDDYNAQRSAELQCLHSPM